MAEFNELWEKMTDKQRRFITAYADLDFAPRKATEAARRAGIADDHTSVESTWVEVHRLLSNASVKAVMALLLQSATLSPEQILARRSAIASADIGDILDESGRPDLGKALKEGKTYMLRAVSYRPTRAGVEVKVELHDPQPSLRALELAHGLDRQRVEVEAGDKMAALLGALVAPWAVAPGQGQAEEERGE